MNTEVNYSSEVYAPASAHNGSAKPRAFPRAAYLSTRHLLLGVFFVLIFTAAARPITDPDFWWHLKTGQFIVQTKSIPHADLFSTFHFGKEWVTHEWLSEVFMYAAQRTLGDPGLIVIFALLITASFVVSYRSFRGRVGHPFIVGFALLVGAFSTFPTWGVRPQIFSLFFASIFLALLDDYARKGEGNRLWWLVPLTVCWVNLHAGFAIGLVLLLLTLVGQSIDVMLAGKSISSAWRGIRVPIVVFLSCLAAVTINPNGTRIYFYPFETLKSSAMMQYISEWWSPDFHEPMFQPLALLMLSTFVVLALSPKRASFRELLLLAATCMASLRSARNIPFFALVAIPLLAEHLWTWIISSERGGFLAKPEKRETGHSAVVKIVLNTVIFVLLPAVIAVARLNNSAKSQARVTALEFPAAAVTFMSSLQMPQPIYNEYGWGGYLIWRLYPDYRVYIDGRADVYGDSFLKEFLMVHDGEPNWREPLLRYGIRTVVIKPSAPLASLLKTDASWKKVFEDSQSVIFTKL